MKHFIFFRIIGDHLQQLKKRMNQTPTRQSSEPFIRKQKTQDVDRDLNLGSSGDVLW